MNAFDGFKKTIKDRLEIFHLCLKCYLLQKLTFQYIEQDNTCKSFINAHVKVIESFF
jgi:hypothetical protein